MFCVSPHWIGRSVHASSWRGLPAGACTNAIATMAVTMISTATCGTRFRMNSIKPSPRTESLLNFSFRTRITFLLVNRRLSCLYGEPTLLLRLDGEPGSGCDSSVSVLEGAVVVGGISVATPSAVMRRSLTVSLLIATPRPETL